MRSYLYLAFGALPLSCMLYAPATTAGPEEGLTFERLAALRSVDSVAVSPDGRLVAYRLNVPRRPDEPDGPAWGELRVIDQQRNTDRAYVTGPVHVSNIQFSVDGRMLTYLAKRADDQHASVWGIPVAGGESKRLLRFDTEIADYRHAPDGKRVAFIAGEPESKARKRAKKNGYQQEVFEEDWRHRRAFITAWRPYDPPPYDPSAKGAPPRAPKPRQVEVEGSVERLEWGPGGQRLAVAVIPRPLVDDRYMFQAVRIVDSTTRKPVATVVHRGKLGGFRFSPDGRNLALVAARDAHDPSDGRLMVVPATGGPPREILPDYEAHVRAVAWRDPDTLVFAAHVGVETELGEVDIDGSNRKTRYASGRKTPGTVTPVSTHFGLVPSSGEVMLVGSTPTHPDEVFALEAGESVPRRITDSNPWLSEVRMAEQDVVRWTARDGLALEGVLIRPLAARLGRPPPLIMVVHGGPESQSSNGWTTTYARPGQIAAARGYAVFYPNYRGSTGRGVAFSKHGQGDAAGKEFDDLVDAVNHLASEGIIDRDRVGVTGGSYGGYATAWCATKFSEHFRAGVMLVGISNALTKSFTTDIPVENKLSHTGAYPWKRWRFSLERSPLYHVEKAKTPLLIAHGREDTRVHPSQSLQLYRALKLLDQVPVRYVRYPGEGHGNRHRASQDDYLRRLMRWMDHFVVAQKKTLPPWDLKLGETVEKAARKEE